jgi:predicted Zn-dependent protease
VNPVSGGPELILLIESDEIKLGKQTDAEVRQEYGVYEDQKLKAYLKDIALPNGMKLKENLPADMPIKVVEKGRKV